MRNPLISIAGLLTTAALFFATPVAAEEISQSRSLTAGIKDIQGMIQRSQERQGIVYNTQEVESEAIAPTSRQAEETENVIEPISIISLPSINKVSDTKIIATEPKVKVLPESTTVFQEVQPNTVFTPNSVFTPNNPATTPEPATDTAPFIEPQSQKEGHQSSQQIATVRHANRHRHQSASDEPPSKSNAMNQGEPTREQQLKHKGFMLFAADLAWNRVDESSDKSIRNPYSLGARLENGVIAPLAAIRVYSPDKLPEALAILAGQKEYT